jgi:hypothetical protein
MRPLVVLPCLVAVLACANTGSEPAGQATITDSAGITIVQDHRWVWGERDGWRVSPGPLLEIGDTTLTGEGRYVATAARLSNGAVVVLTDAGGRRFGPDGAFMGVFASKGEGPGEFQWIEHLVILPGDTIVVGTWRKQAWFASSGALEREVLTDVEKFRGLGRWGECETHLLPDLSMISCQQDSTVPFTETNRPSRLVGQGMSSPGPGLLRQLRRQHRIPASMDTTFPLGIDIGIEQQMIDLGGGNETSVIHPFHARSALAVGGTPMRIVSATNPHWEIEVRSATGKLLQIIRRDGGRRVPTTADQAAADSALRRPDGYVSERDPVLRERVLAAVITPDSLPGHSTIHVTPQGEILSRQFSLWESPAPSLFDVFDVEGRWLGTLSLPSRFRLIEVGDDYLLGLQFDDDDVATLQVFGLER